MSEKCQSLKSIGIVGFGRLGQYITENIQTNGHKLGVRLGFVWNRTKTPLLESTVDKSLILEELSDFDKFNVDLIVEVSHPIIIQKFGPQFIKRSDLMIGSPSSLADRDLELKLMNASTEYSHSLFIPSGALWGPVRQVCSLAPNNVNTMAAAAIAGYTLGFDHTVGCLVSDPNLTEYHKIEIEVIGPENIDKKSTFKVSTTRVSPTSGSADVSSYATFASFWSSILNCEHKGKGFHLC